MEKKWKAEQMGLAEYKPEPLAPWWFRRSFKTDECIEIADRPRKRKNDQKLPSQKQSNFPTPAN